MNHQEVPLPQNVEAEAGVLGSILIDPDAIGQVAEMLRPEDFYHEAHRAIYGAACDLHAAHEPTDLIALCDELSRRGKLEDVVGGSSFVSSLANQVPTSRNVKHYASIVARTATMRRLIKAAGDIAGVAYSNADADAALEQAEKMIADVRTHVERSAKTKEPRYKLLSDEEIMNLEPAAGIVGDILFEDTTAFLYAREGRWKTFLALDWAMSCATGRDWLGRTVKAGPAIYIAAEGALGIGKRIAAWKVHHQVYEPTAIKVLGRAVQLMDAGEVRRLVADIRAQVSEGDPVLIVIDTLARSMSGGHEYDAKDANAVSDAASIIRAAFGCCVLIIHHTGYDQSHMRGSTAFRGNADTIIHITASDDRESVIKPGEPITVTCEKPRDVVPFADITLTAKSVSVAKESGATFDSLVMVPADPAAVQPKALTVNQQKALDVLYLAEGGLRAKKWLAATGIPERSFYDARDVLVAPDCQYVTKDAAGIYSLTADGEQHVTAGLLRPHCEGDSRTANGAEDAPDDDPEFMGTEATAELRVPIGASQFRSSGHTPDTCPTCGEGAAIVRDGDGHPRCSKCWRRIA